MGSTCSFNLTFDFDCRHEPFDRSSQFVVFTGGPLSGKTSVLQSMAVRFEPEIARVYIERELAAGRTKQQIRGNEAQFQRALIDTKLGLESSLLTSRLCFFDRAMPDSITYYRAAGLDPGPIISLCKRIRYAMVFLFDLLPEQEVASVLARDPVRTEDPHTRALLDTYLESDYRKLGYDVIRVPVLSIEDRKAFVLTKLAHHGLYLSPAADGDKGGAS